MPTDRAAGQEWRLAGRYRLGRVLGSGGGGIVREGDDTLLRRRVAVKEVRLPLYASQAERELIGERVLREARAAARLRHPGLVTVYDVIDADDHLWIVMEYVDGMSLAEEIRKSGRLPPLRVARIGIALAYAIETAHRAGVVHRDVKPGNVLIASGGHPRLTDFGIAVTEGDTTLTGTGMLVGSPAYIAPERARGAKASPAGDVWGLGATLFTAVEGEPPYAGEGTLATLAAVVENRRRRFQYAGELAEVLGDLLDSAPTRRPSLAETRVRLREIVERIEPVPDEPDEPDMAVAAVARAVVDVLARDDVPATDDALAKDDMPARDDAAALDEILVVVQVSAVRAESGAPPPHLAEQDRAADEPLRAVTRSEPKTVVASAGARGGVERPPTMLLATVLALLAAVALMLSLFFVDAAPSATPSPSPAALTQRQTDLPPPTPPPTPLTASSGASSTRTSSTGTSSTNPSTEPSTPPSATASAGSSGPAPTSDGNLGALVPSTTTPAPAPAGFTSYLDPSGWSAAVPANWTTRAGGASRVTFAPPSGNPNLLIEAQAEAGPSAIEAWRSLEPAVQASSPDYRLISIRAADGGDGTNAAIWEFTYTNNGQTVRVLDFAVVRNGHGYALRWRAPEDQFSDGLGSMRTIFATFRPGP